MQAPALSFGAAPGKVSAAVGDVSSQSVLSSTWPAGVHALRQLLTSGIAEGVAVGVGIPGRVPDGSPRRCRHNRYPAVTPAAGCHRRSRLRRRPSCMPRALSFGAAPGKVSAAVADVSSQSVLSSTWAAGCEHCTGISVTAGSPKLSPSVSAYQVVSGSDAGVGVVAVGPRGHARRRVVVTPVVAVDVLHAGAAVVRRGAGEGIGRRRRGVVAVRVVQQVSPRAAAHCTWVTPGSPKVSLSVSAYQIVVGFDPGVVVVAVRAGVTPAGGLSSPQSSPSTSFMQAPRAVVRCRAGERVGRGGRVSSQSVLSSTWLAGCDSTGSDVTPDRRRCRCRCRRTRSCRVDHGVGRRHSRSPGVTPAGGLSSPQSSPSTSFMQQPSAVVRCGSREGVGGRRRRVVAVRVVQHVGQPAAVHWTSVTAGSPKVSPSVSARTRP